MITKPAESLYTVDATEALLPRQGAMLPLQCTESSIYQAYLLRFSYDKAAQRWRVAVQSMATQSVQHFATLDAACAFLAAQLTAVSGQCHPPAFDA